MDAAFLKALLEFQRGSTSPGQSLAGLSKAFLRAKAAGDIQPFPHPTLPQAWQGTSKAHKPLVSPSDVLDAARWPVLPEYLAFLIRHNLEIPDFLYPLTLQWLEKYPIFASSFVSVSGEKGVWLMQETGLYDNLKQWLLLPGVSLSMLRVCLLHPSLELPLLLEINRDIKQLSALNPQYLTPANLIPEHLPPAYHKSWCVVQALQPQSYLQQMLQKRWLNPAFSDPLLLTWDIHQKGRDAAFIDPDFWKEEGWQPETELQVLEAAIRFQDMELAHSILELHAADLLEKDTPLHREFLLYAPVSVWQNLLNTHLETGIEHAPPAIHYYLTSGVCLWDSHWAASILTQIEAFLQHPVRGSYPAVLFEKLLQVYSFCAPLPVPRPLKWLLPERNKKWMEMQQEMLNCLQFRKKLQELI